MADGASLRVQLKLEPVRDRGRFTSRGLSEVYKARRDAATRLQADVVKRINAEIRSGGRASASTGRLRAATADRRNVAFDTGYEGALYVGIPDWLDRSEARYWRTFEQGSAATWRRPFVGTPLFFVGNGDRKTPSRHGQVPGIRTSTDEGRMPAAVVKREISPAWAYRDTFRNADQVISEYKTAAARAVLRRALGGD